MKKVDITECNGVVTTLFFARSTAYANSKVTKSTYLTIATTKPKKNQETPGKSPPNPNSLSRPEEPPSKNILSEKKTVKRP